MRRVQLNVCRASRRELEGVLAHELDQMLEVCLAARVRAPGELLRPVDVEERRARHRHLDRPALCGQHEIELDIGEPLPALEPRHRRRRSHLLDVAGLVTVGADVALRVDPVEDALHGGEEQTAPVLAVGDDREADALLEREHLPDGAILDGPQLAARDVAARLEQIGRAQEAPQVVRTHARRGQRRIQTSRLTAFVDHI